MVMMMALLLWPSAHVLLAKLVGKTLLLGQYHCLAPAPADAVLVAACGAAALRVAGF
jgi:hypothetical protein